MQTSKEPNVKDQTNTGKISENMCDYLARLKGLVENDDSDRAIWKAKMVVAQNQRLGVKRYTENPYPGAPDIPLPETDKLIKKQIPNLVLSSWAPKNLCVIDIAPGYPDKPEWKQKAKNAQAAMNKLLRSRKLDWFNKLYLAADYKKTYGHAIFRVREEFTSRICNELIDLSELSDEQLKQFKAMKTEELKQFLADRYMLNLEDEDDAKAIDKAIQDFKAGKELIEISYEKIESFPTVDIPLPTKVIVPNYTTDLAKAQRVTYEYFLPEQTIQMYMDKGIFRKKDLKTLGLSTRDDDIVEQQKMRNEGLADTASTNNELYRIRETLCWYRESEKDEWQRWVFVYLADVGNPEESLLQDNEYPFGFDEWNYNKVDEEIKDPRYYNSRGIPEQNRAYQDVMERCINNMLIRDEMVNTPMWEVLKTSELLDDRVRFVPGQKLPVGQLGTEINQIGSQSMPDLASNNILQTIKAYVEEYQSSNDYLFKNATNQGGGKTLGEVNLGIRQNAQPLQLEVIAWNETLSKVYQKMAELMKDRLGESMWIEGTEVTREDFNFPFECRSNGDLEVADQMLLAQKAAQRLATILNPGLQDIVDSEDRYNALVDWLEKDGVKDPDKFSTHPMKIGQTMIAQLKQQIMQMQQQLQNMSKDANKVSKSISFKDLPPEGKSQLAAQAGIQLSPDAIAFGEVDKKMFDQAGGLDAGLEQPTDEGNPSTQREAGTVSASAGNA